MTTFRFLLNLQLRKLTLRHAVCLVSFLLCSGLATFAYPSRADLVAAPEAEKPYCPERDQWERRTPDELGMDAGLVDKAIAWAKTEETALPKDLSDEVRNFGRVLGPVPAERGDIAQGTVEGRSCERFADKRHRIELWRRHPLAAIALLDRRETRQHLISSDPILRTDRRIAF